MTSKPGERRVARVAADANVLLSAILGHAALRVFVQYDTELVTTRQVLEEVREYLPRLAEQYEVLPEALETQLRLLALREYGPLEYEVRVKDAELAIARRDPDDVGLLALALTLGIPVWSNDDDFKDTGVERFTTARLLKVLGIKRPHE